MSYSSYQRHSFQGVIDRQPQGAKYSRQKDLSYDYKPQVKLSSTSPITRNANANHKNSDNISRNRYSSHQKQYQYDIGDASRARTPSNASKTVNIQNALQDYSSHENPISNTTGIQYTRGGRSGFKQNDSYSKYSSQLAIETPYSQYSTNKYQAQNKKVYLSDIDMEEAVAGYSKFYQSGKISKGQKRTSKPTYENSQSRKPRAIEGHCYDKQNVYDRQFEDRKQRKYEAKDNSILKQNKQIINHERDRSNSYQANRKSQKENSFVDPAQSLKNPTQKSFKSPHQDRRRGQNQRQIMKKISRINSLNQEINNRLQKMITKMGSD